MNKKSRVSKPQYAPPVVKSYGYTTLLRQLGPARAYSHEMPEDDAFILFGVIPTGK